MPRNDVMRAVVRLMAGGETAAPPGPAPHSVGAQWTLEAVLIGLAVLIVIAGLVALGVYALERRSRREQQAVRLQDELMERLRRDVRLRPLSLLPVARVRARGQPTVELHGAVPSDDVRLLALDRAREALAELGVAARVDDRLRVAQPPATRPASGGQPS